MKVEVCCPDCDGGYLVDAEALEAGLPCPGCGRSLDGGPSVSSVVGGMYRGNEMTAAMARAQLAKLAARTVACQENAAWLSGRLAEHEGRTGRLRLHLLGGSLVGLIMVAVAAGFGLSTVLERIYLSLFGGSLISDFGGSIRQAFVGLVIGGAMVVRLHEVVVKGLRVDAGLAGLEPGGEENGGNALLDERKLVAAREITPFREWIRA